MQPRRVTWTTLGAGLVSRLEARRGLVNGTVEKFIAGIAKDGTAEKSLSVFFREAGLIDELETRDAYLQKLADKYAGGQVKDLKAIDATAYLAATETVSAETQWPSSLRRVRSRACPSLVA